MIRALLAFFLTIIVVGGLVLLVARGNPFTVGSVGFISVATDPAGLPVTAGEQLLGTTPINKLKLVPGQVELAVGDTYKETVNITAGATTIVDRSFIYGEALPFGYSVTYERVKSLLGPRTQIVVTAEPSDAIVIRSGTKLGVVPSVITNDLQAAVDLTVQATGAEARSFSVTPLAGYIARVHVVLEANPLNGVEKIDVAGLDIKTIVAGTGPIIPRTRWGESVVYGTPPRQANWTALEIWGLVTNQDDIEGFLAGMDAVAKIRKETVGIPFAYVVTAQGNIYDGLGLNSYDFSQMEGFSYTPSVAPVLIVATDRDFLPIPVRSALAQLLKYFEQAPPVTLKNLSEVPALELKAGETRSLELAFQNTSSVILRKDGAFRLVFETEAGRQSEFYDPLSWISLTQVAGAKEDLVYPGGTVHFIANIRAPYYAGQFVERFEIYDRTRNTKVPDATISLAITVTGDLTRTLIIKDTPTGSLNVRTGPSLVSPLVTTVFPGEKLAWVQESNNWYEVVLRDGSRGWVTGTYVTVQ